MFKRKKQPVPPPKPQAHVVAQRRTVAPKLSVSDCLTQAQAALQKLRALNPGDVQAFPLLNEIQRLVQQLKVTTSALPPADKDAWTYQISDLEEDFRELADVVVARADAAPKPEPRVAASPAASFSSTSGRGPHAVTPASTPLQPSTSGRVQQAVALFSRQASLNANSGQSGTATGLRRAHGAAPQQQSRWQSEQQDEGQQQQHHYLQGQQAQQAYTPASTPSGHVLSPSSHIFLTDEERQLLAQKQQALLLKHHKYLEQQRAAFQQQQKLQQQQQQDLNLQYQAAHAGQQQHYQAYHQQQLYQQYQQQEPAMASVSTAQTQDQQMPTGNLPQQLRGVQYADAGPHRADGPQSEYSSMQATPHGYSVDAGQSASAVMSPAWSTAAAQQPVWGAGAAWGPAAAQWQGGVAVGPDVGQQAQQQAPLGLYPLGQHAPAASAVQQPEDMAPGGRDGTDGDDLFSGLDIVAAADEPHSGSGQPPHGPDSASVEPDVSTLAHQWTISRASDATAAAESGATATPAAANTQAATMSGPVAGPGPSFRPAGHSVPHTMYSTSQTGQPPAGTAHAISQGALPIGAAMAASASSAASLAGSRSQSPLPSNLVASALSNQQGHLQGQPHMHGGPQQEEPYTQQVAPNPETLWSHAQQDQQYGEQYAQSQRALQQQQEHVRQDAAQPAAASQDAYSGSVPVKGPMSQYHLPAQIGMVPGQALPSPFAQAATGGAPDIGVATDAGGAPYPIRKKTSHIRLGCSDTEREADSQGQFAAAAPLAAAGASAGWMPPASTDGVGPSGTAGTATQPAIELAAPTTGLGPTSSHQQQARPQHGACEHVRQPQPLHLSGNPVSRGVPPANDTTGQASASLSATQQAYPYMGHYQQQQPPTAQPALDVARYPPILGHLGTGAVVTHPGLALPGRAQLQQQSLPEGPMPGQLEHTTAPTCVPHLQQQVQQYPPLQLQHQQHPQYGVPCPGSEEGSVPVGGQVGIGQPAAVLDAGARPPLTAAPSAPAPALFATQPLVPEASRSLTAAGMGTSAGAVAQSSGDAHSMGPASGWSSSGPGSATAAALGVSARLPLNHAYSSYSTATDPRVQQQQQQSPSPLSATEHPGVHAATALTSATMPVPQVTVGGSIVASDGVGAGAVPAPAHPPGGISPSVLRSPYEVSTSASVAAAHAAPSPSEVGLGLGLDRQRTSARGFHHSSLPAAGTQASLPLPLLPPRSTPVAVPTGTGVSMPLSAAGLSMTPEPSARPSSSLSLYSTGGAALSTTAPQPAAPVSIVTTPLHTPISGATAAGSAARNPSVAAGPVGGLATPSSAASLSHHPINAVAALRSRSRGLTSGGGATSIGGGVLASDPAASLPSQSGLPNLADLEAFLDGITGPVDSCRAAAEQRVWEMVSALGGASAQAQKVEAATQQQRRSVKAALAGIVANIDQLETDQAAAVEAEDFDTAAALDEQLTQLSYRRTNLDEQDRQLATALRRAAGLRLEVLGRQAEAWRVTGAYLARLQAGQQQMAAALAAQADREVQAATMLHRAAQEALAQRRAVLGQRQRELQAASADVAARVAAATAPAEAERQRRADVRDILQAEVESLRALLAAKEAALAAAEASVVEAAEVVRQQAAAFDRETARLVEARGMLAAEEAQVAGQDQALQESERQAAARAAAVEEHQAQLRLQAESLGAAADSMRGEAETLARRVEAEARGQEQRERLQQADEAAKEELKALERCITDLSADLSRLAEQRGRLAAERAAAQEGLAALQRSLPELEAAKRAAAASKDFREAARLSGELRALTVQADVAAAQVSRLSMALSELTAAESGKVSELQELRAMVHEAQRRAAEAHYRYLVFCLGLSRAALDQAVAAELYEEAGALQAEVSAEEAEALVLERTWGFIRPGSPAAAGLPGPAPAAACPGAAVTVAPARRRSSLGATSSASPTTAVGTVQLSQPLNRPPLVQNASGSVSGSAQVAGTGLGPPVGLTAQHSASSLSSQLPQWSPQASTAGGIQVGSLLAAAATASAGGAAAVALERFAWGTAGAAGSTLAGAWQLTASAPSSSPALPPVTVLPVVQDAGGAIRTPSMAGALPLEPADMSTATSSTYHYQPPTLPEADAALAATSISYPTINVAAPDGYDAMAAPSFSAMAGPWNPAPVGHETTSVSTGLANSSSLRRHVPLRQSSSGEASGTVAATEAGVVVAGCHDSLQAAPLEVQGPAGSLDPAPHHEPRALLSAARSADSQQVAADGHTAAAAFVGTEPTGFSAERVEGMQGFDEVAAVAAEPAACGSMDTLSQAVEGSPLTAASSSGPYPDPRLPPMTLLDNPVFSYDQRQDSDRSPNRADMSGLAEQDTGRHNEMVQSAAAGAAGVVATDGAVGMQEDGTVTAGAGSVRTASWGAAAGSTSGTPDEIEGSGALL